LPLTLCFTTDVVRAKQAGPGEPGSRPLQLTDGLLLGLAVLNVGPSVAVAIGQDAGAMVRNAAAAVAGIGSGIAATFRRETGTNAQSQGQGRRRGKDGILHDFCLFVLQLNDCPAPAGQTRRDRHTAYGDQSLAAGGSALAPSGAPEV